MDKEELLKLVNEKEDTSKFTSLSQKTINEELDDVLEDFGDDEAANANLVTKLANRLKRMDGNLHKNVSDEIKKSKEEAERKKREEEEERKRKEAGEDKTDPDDKYNELLKEIKALKEANAERDKKAARKATIESVKAGLKDKFDKASLELNDFFLDTALSKLEISDDADVAELVSTAENIYTADYKRANGGNAVPRKGSSASSGEEKKLDEHEWDDIKDICKDRATKATVKK